MPSTTRTIATSLLLLVAVACPAWAQGKSELTIALSSFSAETVDPALQGHNVKYYLSLMFAYLVGVTPDGAATAVREDLPASCRFRCGTPPRVNRHDHALAAEHARALRYQLRALDRRGVERHLVRARA